MNRKIIFVLMVLFVAVASLFSVSAWWIFGDSGTDVTVNGVDFSILEGFKYYELAGNPETESQFALYSDDGKQALAFIHIKVSDNISPSSELAKTLSSNNKVTINGKECYIETYGDSVFCAYYSGDKAVQLNVPYSYTYNNNEISYEDTLAQMIK